MNNQTENFICNKLLQLCKVYVYFMVCQTMVNLCRMDVTSDLA